MQLNDFNNIKKSILLKEASSEDTSPKMIGEPDGFYDAEERTKAYDEMQDAVNYYSKDSIERENILDGICPNCGGNGYQDGEEEMWDDDEEEYVEGNECDGWGNYGCDQGEMTYGSEEGNWIEIIKHDKRNAERQKAKADYPGDEEVIKQVASYMKRMDDPRMAYQQMQADFPHMGRGQRSEILGKASKIAFGEGSIKEKAPSDAIWGIFINGKDIAVRYASRYEAEKYAEELRKNNPKSEYEVKKANPEKIEEGEERSIIQDACIEKLVDAFSGRENQFANKEDFEYAIYQALEDLDVEDCVDPDMEVGGQRIGDFASGRVIDVCSSSSIIYDVMANMDETQIGEGTYDWADNPKIIDKHDKPKKKKKQEEDMDKDNESDEAGVSKMLAKALGDSNRWTEMSAPELYAELESMDSKKAEMIALVAKMIYDVKLTEANSDESMEESYDCDDTFFEDYGYLGYSIDENDMFEAEYRGRKVKLNKPMQGDVKKFKVYVKDPKTGNVKKVNFGHGGSSVKGKTMRIRKSNPKARKSFRARHNCSNPGPKTKARYWSCRKW